MPASGPPPPQSKFFFGFASTSRRQGPLQVRRSAARSLAFTLDSPARQAAMFSKWDDFLYWDYPRWSSLGGQISTGATLAVGIIGCFIGHALGTCIYTVFMTPVFAFFEVPMLYSCIEPCTRLRFKLMDEDNAINCTMGIVRAPVYILISAFMYIGTSVCILPAILWDLTALLYLAKVFQARWEKANGMQGAGGYQEVGGEQGKFGTF